MITSKKDYVDNDFQKITSFTNNEKEFSVYGKMGEIDGIPVVSYGVIDEKTGQALGISPMILDVSIAKSLGDFVKNTL